MCVPFGSRPMALNLKGKHVALDGIEGSIGIFATHRPPKAKNVDDCIKHFQQTMVSKAKVVCQSYF